MKNEQLDHTHHTPAGKVYPITLLAHDIDVPMNIGSLFRIADALGVEKIYLSGSSLTPPNGKIRKTSRAAEKYVPFSYEKSPLTVIDCLRSLGYKIYSLELTSSSTDLKEVALRGDEKICLILGSEKAGVSQELLDRSDETIHIPMLGHCSSMNVAVACSIAIYELSRRLK